MTSEHKPDQAVAGTHDKHGTATHKKDGAGAHNTGTASHGAMGDVKRYAKAFWHFLWHEDSVASWVANVIVAFVLIKFIVYPVLGLVLGTQYPIVAVVSESMEHQGTFDDWWESDCRVADGMIPQSTLYGKYRIDRDTFRTFPMRNGFNKGDLMLLVSADGAKTGDVLVFAAPGFNDPIIHRIVERRENGDKASFDTKGDHNCGQSAFERGIGEERVFGKAALRIPLLGWIKIGFVKLVGYVIGGR